MNVFVKTAAAVALLAVAFGPAFAQGQAPAQPEPPAASVALAKEILAAKDAQLLYKDAVVGMVSQTRDIFLKSHLDKQRDLTEVAGKLVKDLAGREQEVGDAMAKAYASGFTEPELKEVLAFYKSPLGKKVIANEPKALEQTMAFIDVWSQKFGAEIEAKFREEMKKRGKEI